MKQLSKISILVSLILLTAACSTYKWSTLSNDMSVEQVMQEKFPTLYAKSKAGEIMIDKVEQRVDKNGEIIFRVRYTKKTSDDDMDTFIQQTIYDPLLNH